MRSLDCLRDHLDELEADNDEAHKFVQRLLIEQEEGRDFSQRPLTGRQFKWLNDLQQRYCL